MKNMIKNIAENLTRKSQTISFAESCTGGQLSSIFVTQPGISKVYEGSVVAYSNSIKKQVLGVPAPLLLSVGAVSQPVAKAMARGVRDLTKSSWAVSITGIAGPGGGTKHKPVGMVCFGLVGPGIELAVTKNFEGDREKIQSDSVDFALQIITEHLRGR